jgi:hypothetical protein
MGRILQNASLQFLSADAAQEKKKVLLPAGVCTPYRTVPRSVDPALCVTVKGEQESVISSDTTWQQCKSQVD